MKAIRAEIGNELEAAPNAELARDILTRHTEMMRELMAELRIGSQNVKSKLAQEKERISHLQHLSTLPESGESAAEFWKHTEIQTARYISEYMVRKGYFRAYEGLQAETGLAYWMEKDIVEPLVGIVSQLRAGDHSLALAWVEKHETALLRMGSDACRLFRTQELARMIVVEKKEPTDVIQYIQESLKNEPPEDVEEVLQMLLEPALAGKHLTAERYKSLEDIFIKSYLIVHGFPGEDVFADACRAGMKHMKTASCSRTSAHVAEGCPMCSGIIMDAGIQVVPKPPRTSLLLCPVTKHRIPPGSARILPNGHVLSEDGVELCRSGERGGLVTCPFTQAEFLYEDVRRIYP